MIRLAFKIVAGIVAVVVAYFAVTFAQVWWASRGDDRAPASAIVVLGAAQWNGQPSPVLRARLDHAAELYQAGVAPVIIVTGGKQPGDRVTQGFAGYDYLRGKGIPDRALKVEVEGADTYTELSASANILRRGGLGSSVVLVSDPYHAYRAQAIADEVGLHPHFSAADTSSPLPALLRETAAVGAGRVLSYRRLSSLS